MMQSNCGREFVSDRFHLTIISSPRSAARCREFLRLRPQGGKAVEQCERSKQQAEQVIARAEPPGCEVLFDIEDALQAEADAPEDRHKEAEAAGQAAATGELARVEQADQPK